MHTKAKSEISVTASFYNYNPQGLSFLPFVATTCNGNGAGDGGERGTGRGQGGGGERGNKIYQEVVVDDGVLTKSKLILHLCNVEFCQTCTSKIYLNLAYLSFAHAYQKKICRPLALLGSAYYQTKSTGIAHCVQHKTKPPW